MNSYFRGLVPGLFFGVALGFFLMQQPENGWLRTLTAMSGVAALMVLDFFYLQRKNQAGAI